MTKLIGPLLIIIALLQIVIIVQLSDHDNRMETRHSYAIDARNAIRDQLDQIEKDIGSVESTCRRGF